MSLFCLPKSLWCQIFQYTNLNIDIINLKRVNKAWYTWLNVLHHSDFFWLAFDFRDDRDDFHSEISRIIVQPNYEFNRFTHLQVLSGIVSNHNIKEIQKIIEVSAQYLKTVRLHFLPFMMLQNSPLSLEFPSLTEVKITGTCNNIPWPETFLMGSDQLEIIELDMSRAEDRMFHLLLSPQALAKCFQRNPIRKLRLRQNQVEDLEIWFDFLHNVIVEKTSLKTFILTTRFLSESLSHLGQMLVELPQISLDINLEKEQFTNEVVLAIGQLSRGQIERISCTGPLKAVTPFLGTYLPRYNSAQSICLSCSLDPATDILELAMLEGNCKRIIELIGGGFRLKINPEIFYFDGVPTIPIVQKSLLLLNKFDAWRLKEVVIKFDIVDDLIIDCLEEFLPLNLQLRVFSLTFPKVYQLVETPIFLLNTLKSSANTLEELNLQLVVLFSPVFDKIMELVQNIQVLKVLCIEGYQSQGFKLDDPGQTCLCLARIPTLRVLKLTVCNSRGLIIPLLNTVETNLPLVRILKIALSIPLPKEILSLGKFGVKHFTTIVELLRSSLSGQSKSERILPRIWDCARVLRLSRPFANDLAREYIAQLEEATSLDQVEFLKSSSPLIQEKIREFAYNARETS